MDALLGIHADALTLRSRRSELLARNLANADTPNYLARDFDFAETLRGITTGNGPLTGSHERHYTSEASAFSDQDLLYRVPNQPALDGNTVDTDTERAEFTRNSLAYEASLRFLSSRVGGLLTAIRGE